MRPARRISTRGAAAVLAAALLATVAPAGTARASHGSLDPTFDGDGRLGTGAHALDGGAVAVLPDGRILAAAAGVPNLVLMRLLPDGSRDGSFGTGGTVQMTADMSVAEVLVQPDGGIVVAGNGIADGTFRVRRFLADGAVDTGFGSGGGATTALVGVTDRVTAAALQPDGRIVVAGVAGQPPVSALVRFLADGTLDASFGAGGKVLDAPGADRMATPEDLAVQADGRILAAGRAGRPGEATRLAVARLTTTGTLDPTFDGDGVLVGQPGGALAVALQPDGSAVVAGFARSSERALFLLMRLRSDGTPDPRFDGDGAVTTDFDSDTGAVASAVAVGPDGRIAAAGSVSVEGRSRFAVARYEPDGSPDRRFDGDGRTTTVAGSQPASIALDVALDPAGRILVAGAESTPGRPSNTLVLARYLAAAPAHRGYWLAASDGGVFAFGDAPFLGSTGGMVLNRPIVGLAAKPGGDGYWLVASDGGVFAFGSARFHGSTGGRRLSRPIVGMAATPSGLGYWLVASDGGVFAFGDAVFHGSTGAIRLAQPVVGMTPTPSGRGYWLVASDGGVFAFGDATFWGSAGAIRLASPVVGMAADLDGTGYRLVAADGGVFAYRAGFFGSTGGRPLASPIVGLAAATSYDGYWLGAADGGMFAFGTHPFLGSTGAIRLAKPVVGLAARE